MGWRSTLDHIPAICACGMEEGLIQIYCGQEGAIINELYKGKHVSNRFDGISI